MIFCFVIFFIYILFKFLFLYRFVRKSLLFMNKNTHLVLVNFSTETKNLFNRSIQFNSNSIKFLFIDEI